MSALIQEIWMNEYNCKNLSKHAIGLARFYPHNITLQVNICMYILLSNSNCFQNKYQACNYS